MWPWPLPLDLTWETVLSSFTPDVSAALGGPAWLVRRRADAAGRLEATAMPSEAEEIWRYSGIDRFSLDGFSPVLAAPPAADLDRARKVADSFGSRSALVVTSGGTVLAVECGEHGAGLVSVAGDGPLGGGPSTAPAPPDARPEHSGDAFELLHDAFVRDMVLIEVAARKVVADPLVIVHLVDATSAAGFSAFPHTVVRVGPGAEVGVIEICLAPSPDDPTPALVVPVADLQVDDGSHLAYAALQVLGTGATHVGTQRSRVGRDGTLRSFSVGLGGSYARVRTDSDLVGQGGRTSLLAAYLGVAEQVHDFRTLQDHHAPRTESELLFTGAVADTARSVYSGLIRIRRGAKRADARQTNHNLVLSQGAHADSVPNLDIDENDVRCSHASTVGPIDEDQRYYLESRGIEPVVAERLIVLGFFSSLAARSPFAELGKWVEKSVATRLAGRLPAEASAQRSTGG